MSTPQTPRDQLFVSVIAESTTAVVAGVALTPSRGSTPGTNNNNNKSSGMLASPTMRVAALGVPPLFRYAAAPAGATAKVPERSASAPPPQTQASGSRVSFNPDDVAAAGEAKSTSKKPRRPGSSARTPSPSVRVSSGLAKDIKKLMKGTPTTSAAPQPRPRRASPTPPRPPLDKPEPPVSQQPTEVPTPPSLVEREPSPAPRPKAELPVPTAPSHSPEDTARMPGSLSPLSPLSQTRERAADGEAVTSTAFRVVSHGLTQCREICPSALGAEFASAIIATSTAGDSTNASVARATPLISPAFDSPARPGRGSAAVSPAPSPSPRPSHGKAYHGTHARDCPDHYQHHQAAEPAEPEVEVFGGELREAVVDLREAFTDFEAVCSTHDELGAIIALHGLQVLDDSESFDSRVRVLTWSKRVRELESRAAKAASSVDRALRHRRTGGATNHSVSTASVSELREMDLSVDEGRVADLYEHALQQVLEETGALLRLHERFRLRVEELESLIVQAEEERASHRSRSGEGRGHHRHRRTASSDAQVQTVQPASPPAAKVAKPETSTQSNQTSPLQKREERAKTPPKPTRRVVQGVPVTPPESPVRGVVVNAIPLPAAVTDASAAERDSRHQALLRNETRRSSSTMHFAATTAAAMATDTDEQRREKLLAARHAAAAKADAAAVDCDDYSPRQRRLAELAARNRGAPAPPPPEVSRHRVVTHHSSSLASGGLHLWEAPERAPAVPKLPLGDVENRRDPARRTAAAAAILGGHQQQPLRSSRHVWESATSYEPVGPNASHGSVQPPSANTHAVPVRVVASAMSAASPSGKRYSLTNNNNNNKPAQPLEPADPTRCTDDCPEYLDHYHAALLQVSQQQITASSSSARQQHRNEPVTSRAAHPDDTASAAQLHHRYALSPPTARLHTQAPTISGHQEHPQQQHSPSPARRPTEPEPFDFLTERRSCNRCVRHLRVQLTGVGDKENRAAASKPAASRGWDSSPNPHSHHRVVPRVSSPSALKQKQHRHASPTRQAAKPVAMHQQYRGAGPQPQLRGRSSVAVASRLDFRTAEEVAAQQSHIEATRPSSPGFVSPTGRGVHRAASTNHTRRLGPAAGGRAHVVPVPVGNPSRHGGRRHVEAPFQAREGRQHIDPTRWVATSSAVPRDCC